MIATPTVYLASPIDQGQTKSEKTRAIEHLLDRQCAVFDPSAGWKVPAAGRPNSTLQRGNLAILRQCHGLLAILKADILTIGVVLEIQEAIDCGMPIQVYSPDMQPSWSLNYLGVTPHRDLIQAIHDLWKDMQDV